MTKKQTKNPGFQHTYLILGWLLSSVLTQYTILKANDEPVTSFALTDYSGFAELRFAEDVQSHDEEDSSNNEIRTNFEQEIFIQSQSYIYHPNLLTINLGFGPIFSQGELNYNNSTVTEESTKYSLSTRLLLLQEKSYPVALYYDKKYPTLALSMTDQFQQEVEKSGINLKLRKPMLPLNIEIEAFKLNTSGQGFDIRIDDSTEQISLRTEIPMGADGHNLISLNSTDISSSSGFISEPLTTVLSSRDNASIDSRLFLGENNHIQLVNNLSYTKHSGIRFLEEVRFNPQLRWDHTDDLMSFYHLSYRNSNQMQVKGKEKSFTAGMRYSMSDTTNINLELHSDENDTTGLNLSKTGVAIKLNYNNKFSFGDLSLSGSLNYDIFDRQATSTVPVDDLIINLTGPESRFLPHDNIFLNTIRAFRLFNGNEAELQVGIDTGCQQGIDIMVTSIGSRTQVENCNGSSDGNIAVIFEYEYDPGGTVEYANLVQGYQASLNFLQYANVYLRYRDSSVDIMSGQPILALEESTNTIVGGRVDYPVYDSFIIGAVTSIEKEQGTRISFDRESLEAYLQFRLFKGKIRISQQRDTIDYFDTVDDVELIRNRVQYQVQPWNQFTLSLDAGQEDDTGGLYHRERNTLSLKLDWRIRELIVSGEARMVEEQHDYFFRDRSRLRLSVRRNF